MDTTKKIEHTFSNGSTFTGTFEELKKVASSLGLPLTGLKITPPGHYNSSTDGLVAIKDMHSHHIRRALLKATKDYFGKVYANKETNTQFLAKFAGMMEDQVIQELLNELVTRGDEMLSEKATPLAAAASAPPKPAAKKAIAKKVAAGKAYK